MAHEHYGAELRPSPVPSSASVSAYTTRYFLRCLAKNRRESRSTAEWLPYAKALLDSAFVFIAMPTVAMFSVIGFASLRYFPRAVTLTFGLAPRSFIVVIVFGSLFAGYTWFRHRFRAYPYDTEAYTEFDSERDRAIVFQLRLASIMICGLAIPFLSGILFLAML